MINVIVSMNSLQKKAWKISENEEVEGGEKTKFQALSLEAMFD